MKITKKELNVAFYNMFNNLFTEKQFDRAYKKTKSAGLKFIVPKKDEIITLANVWLTEDTVITSFLTELNPDSICFGIFYPFSKEENKMSENYTSYPLDTTMKSKEEIETYIEDSLFTMLSETLKNNDIKIKRF